VNAMDIKSKSQIKQIISWFTFYPGILILLIQMSYLTENKLAIIIGCCLSFVGLIIRDDLFNKAVYKNTEERFKGYFLACAVALLAISIGFLFFAIFHFSGTEIIDCSKLIATFFGLVVLYFLLPLEICLFKHYRGT
jgi:hypothetical protein